jgi:hypothetical protein
LTRASTKLSFPCKSVRIENEENDFPQRARI